MKLKIMFLDETVKEFVISRLFTINASSKEQFLYYETHSDIEGKGTSISMSEIKCWEATATVHGGFQELKL